MGYPFISTIIPLLKAKEYDIGGLVDGYVAVLQNLKVKWELILILEESNRSRIIESLGSINEQVHLLFTPTADWGAAVKMGLEKANGDILSYSNWLSTSPENLRVILSTALANPDVVIKATRRMHRHWLRRVGGALYSLECQYLFDLPYWDVNATPRAFPRRFEKLMKLQSRGFLMETEFCIVCQRASYQVLEVPIRIPQRYPRLSISGWVVDAKLYYGAYKLYRELAKIL